MKHLKVVSGYKESQFYCLPFRHVAASTYQPQSHFKSYFCSLNTPSKLHFPIGQNKLAKYTSPGLSDTTFFACGVFKLFLQN